MIDAIGRDVDYVGSVLSFAHLIIIDIYINVEEFE